jgi:hypothetical protein
MSAGGGGGAVADAALPPPRRPPPRRRAAPPQGRREAPTAVHQSQLRSSARPHAPLQRSPPQPPPVRNTLHTCAAGPSAPLAVRDMTSTTAHGSKVACIGGSNLRPRRAAGWPVGASVPARPAATAPGCGPRRRAPPGPHGPPPPRPGHRRCLHCLLKLRLQLPSAVRDAAMLRGTAAARMLPARACKGTKSKQ